MQPYPLTFEPVLKQLIWGGRKLGERLGKPIGAEANYAESWEIVDHGRDQSVVTNGPLAGTSLAKVIAAQRSWLLGEDAPQGPFPLLLKYLDCHRALSVQVHPDDRYAAQMPQPDLGKTEAWYVVAADPGARIYAGLRPGVDRRALESALQSDRCEDALHSFQPRAGDLLFIPAGTVHALGAGLLVAEIQQSSDTTFRLFDWNRVDASGQPRPLHWEQALEVIDFSTGPVSPRRADPAVEGWQIAVTSDKFVLRLIELGGGTLGGDGKFHIVTVPRGTASLRDGSTTTALTAGDSVLLPAAIKTCEIDVGPESTVLSAHLP